MINRYIKILHFGIGICLGVVSLLFIEILKEPTIPVPYETVDNTIIPSIVGIAEEPTICEPTSAKDGIDSDIVNDKKNQTIPLRTLEAIIKHGLTSKEREWLREHKTHYAVDELQKKHWLVEDITAKVTTLDNTATRRYLVDTLHGLDNNLLENVIFRLAESEREIDHITAAVLLKSTKNKALQQDTLETLLSEYEESLLIKSIAKEFGTIIHQPHLENSLSRLYEIYTTTANVDVKSEIIESITPKNKIKDLQFYKLLSMLENDSKIEALERSKNIKSWISSNLHSFTKSQLNTLAFYSSNIFQNSKNIKIKKISILIDQELNEVNN